MYTKINLVYDIILNFGSVPALFFTRYHGLPPMHPIHTVLSNIQARHL